MKASTDRIPSLFLLSAVADETLQKVLHASFSGSTYDLESCDNAEDLKAYQADSPQLIFLDDSFGPNGSLDLLRSLRAQPEFAEVPILYFSAVQDDELRVEAVDLGASAALAYPLTPEILTATVNAVLAVRRLAHEHQISVQ